ncbi:hypothetical protein J3458_022082 [Metarhizium acridum]|uniref:uncharacterized protein n=1 Tax=Metarhizium acridum TaxID=92637 RepID=UPI001C6A98D1|nr:hypothetical protein J3458_022082 [Metarhizium acridum]
MFSVQPRQTTRVSSIDEAPVGRVRSETVVSSARATMPASSSENSGIEAETIVLDPLDPFLYVEMNSLAGCKCVLPVLPRYVLDEILHESTANTFHVCKSTLDVRVVIE